jgi:pimeloyl-ACP methyl ester carboxylesterase
MNTKLDMGFDMLKQILGVLLFMLLLTPNTQAFEIEEFGLKEGHTLIFIPGLASHGELWKPWIDQYKETHRVFVMTAPGFAGVDPQRNPAGFFQARIDEVSEFLERNHVRGAYVIGHSIGGLMSLMLAEQHPDLVERALVVDSLPYMAGLFAPGLTPEQAAQQAKFLQKQMLEMPYSAFVAQQKQGAYILSKKAEFIPTLHRWAETSDQKTVSEAFGEAFAMDYRQKLKNIEARVTVLVAHEPRMPITRPAIESLFNEQYAGLGNIQIKILDDSFHFIMIDQPTMFNQALANFIK